jgi:hypothetical protein
MPPGTFKPRQEIEVWRGGDPRFDPAPKVGR